MSKGLLLSAGYEKVLQKQVASVILNLKVVVFSHTEVNSLVQIHVSLRVELKLYQYSQIHRRTDMCTEEDS